MGSVAISALRRPEWQQTVPCGIDSGIYHIKSPFLNSQIRRQGEAETNGYLGMPAQMAAKDGNHEDRKFDHCGSARSADLFRGGRIIFSSAHAHPALACAK